MNAISTMVASQSFKNEIATRLEDSINGRETEKYAKMFLTAINKEPKLQLCTRESAAIAFYNLCELKLSPIAAHGLAYLIPYGSECQLQISYKGIIALAMRDGGVRWITAELVYKGEKFKCLKGSANILEHEIDFFTEIDRSPENIVGGYACAELLDGSKVFILMSHQQLMEHKRRYVKTKNVWDKSPEEMMKKTLIKRLCKTLPVSKNHDLLRAIELDNETTESVNISSPKDAISIVESIKADLLEHDTTAQDFFNEEKISHDRIMENSNKFMVNIETGEIVTSEKAQKITLEEQIDAYITIIKESKTLPELDETYKKYYKILTKTAGLEQRHFKSLTDAADIHKVKLQEQI